MPGRVLSPMFWRGLFRRFRSTVLRSEVRIVGRCRCCGNCCREIMIRCDGRWISSRRRFTRLCRDEPDYERFEITGRDEENRLMFSCTFLGRDNFCKDYDFRLPMCRAYPSKILYYQGGDLGADCGFSYKARRFRDAWRRRKQGTLPFSQTLEQARRTQDRKDS